MAAGEGADALVIKRQADGLLHERVAHVNADLGVVVGLEEDKRVAQPFVDLHVGIILEAGHLVSAEVKGDVKIARFKLQLLRGRFGQVADDDALDGGRRTVVVLVAHEHSLDLRIPLLKDVGAGACRVVVEPLLGGVSGVGVGCGRATLCLDHGLAGDAEGAEYQLGEDGGVGIGQRQDDGCVIGRFDRDDAVSQEGGVALDVDHAVEGEDDVACFHGVAIGEDCGGVEREGVDQAVIGDGPRFGQRRFNAVDAARREGDKGFVRGAVDDGRQRLVGARRVKRGGVFGNADDKNARIRGLGGWCSGGVTCSGCGGRRGAGRKHSQNQQECEVQRRTCESRGLHGRHSPCPKRNWLG